MARWNYRIGFYEQILQHLRFHECKVEIYEEDL